MILWRKNAEAPPFSSLDSGAFRHVRSLVSVKAYQSTKCVERRLTRNVGSIGSPRVLHQEGVCTQFWWILYPLNFFSRFRRLHVSRVGQGQRPQQVNSHTVLRARRSGCSVLQSRRRYATGNEPNIQLFLGFSRELLPSTSLARTST